MKIPLTLLTFLLVIIHFVFLMLYFAPAISTPDAHSYFTQAKLIASEGKTYFEPESVLQYVGPHWNHTTDHCYYCTHPPGLPTILAPIYLILTPEATLLVNPLMASLSLLGLFLLCRLWISKGWGLLAAALMAAHPVANEHALLGDSHAAVVFFLIWGMFFFTQWLKTHSPWWALSAGFFLGIIPTIRYSEMLYLLSVGIFVLLYLRNNKVPWRSLAAGGIGVAVPVGALFIRNQLAYGAFWKTGYTLTKEQSAFGLNHFVKNAPLYLQKLIIEANAFVFVLGVIGIAFLCTHRQERNKGLLLALLVIPITLLYMSWYWTPDPQSIRFLLPTLYLYAIAAVWLLHFFNNKYRRSVRIFSALLLVMTIGWGLPKSYMLLQHLKTQNAALLKVTNKLKERVESGSLLISYEGSIQHLDFLGKWRLISFSTFKPKTPQMPLAEVNPSAPQAPPRNQELLKRYGKLPDDELFVAITGEMWSWAGKQRKVYLLANEERINTFKKQIPPSNSLATIDRIELPKVNPDHMRMPTGFAPPKDGPEGFARPEVPMTHRNRPSPNQIFDLTLNGESLFIVQWMRELQ